MKDRLEELKGIFSCLMEVRDMVSSNDAKVFKLGFYNLGVLTQSLVVTIEELEKYIDEDDEEEDKD